MHFIRIKTVHQIRFGAEQHVNIIKGTMKLPTPRPAIELKANIIHIRALNLTNTQLRSKMNKCTV